jgi:hypothetical protein
VDQEVCAYGLHPPLNNSTSRIPNCIT